MTTEHLVDRAATRERLRQLIRDIEARPPAPRPAVVHVRAPQRLDDEWRDFGGVMVRDYAYPVEHVHGEQPFEALRHTDGALLELLGGDEALADAAVEDLRFLDIEATGLGGAGAMVFLVAVARWTPDGVALRQYLAPSPPAELPLLQQLVADCSEGPREAVLVTYNGATYDAPFLDQRGTLHRVRTGFESFPHLDLLKPVRRGLRDAVRPHRLAHIERLLLGVVRDEGEVAGAEVPAWYFRYLRTGDARMLTSIIDHNAFDVLSLAAFVARMASVVAHEVPGSAYEQLLLGRLYERAGRVEESIAHLEAARTAVASEVTRHLVALELARSLRRLGRRPEAVALWREVAVGRVAPTTALIELAKHHEHQLRDYEAALRHVDRALRTSGPTEALLHRRARLLRRLERANG